jgi:hypothetical protein
MPPPPRCRVLRRGTGITGCPFPLQLEIRRSTMAEYTDQGSVATDETNRLIASSKVEGTAVYNRQGERLGSVYNFMVDKVSGQVAYAVMSFGGFLGIGDSYHPLPSTARSWRVRPSTAQARILGRTRTTDGRSTTTTGSSTRTGDEARRAGASERRLFLCIIPAPVDPCPSSARCPARRCRIHFADLSVEVRAPACPLAGAIPRPPRQARADYERTVRRHAPRLPRSRAPADEPARRESRRLRQFGATPRAGPFNRIPSQSPLLQPGW